MEVAGRWILVAAISKPYWSWVEIPRLLFFH